MAVSTPRFPWEQPGVIGGLPGAPGVTGGPANPWGTPVPGGVFGDRQPQNGYAAQPPLWTPPDAGTSGGGFAGWQPPQTGGVSPGGGFTDRMPMGGVSSSVGPGTPGWQPPQDAGVSPWGGFTDRMPMSGGVTGAGDYTNLLPPAQGAGGGFSDAYSGDPYYQTFVDPNLNGGGAWGFQQPPEAFVGGVAPSPGGPTDRMPLTGGVSGAPGGGVSNGPGSGGGFTGWQPPGTAGVSPGDGFTDRMPMTGGATTPGVSGGGVVSGGGQSPADVAAYWGSNPQGDVRGMGRVVGGGGDRQPQGNAFGFYGNASNGQPPPFQGFIDSMPQDQRDTLMQLMNQGYPFQQAYRLMMGQL